MGLIPAVGCWILCLRGFDLLRRLFGFGTIDCFVGCCVCGYLWYLFLWFVIDCLWGLL